MVESQSSSTSNQTRPHYQNQQLCQDRMKRTTEIANISSLDNLHISEDWQLVIQIGGLHELSHTAIPCHTLTPENMEQLCLEILPGEGSTFRQLLHSLLQPCYELDQQICGKTPELEAETSSWQDLDPFDYLSSPDLLARWKTELEELCHQYINGTFTPENFEKKLEVILLSVARLEGAREKLQKELEDQVEESGLGVVVPKAFWTAIEERCKIIDDTFRDLESALEEQDAL